MNSWDSRAPFQSCSGCTSAQGASQHRQGAVALWLFADMLGNYEDSRMMVVNLLISMMRFLASEDH